MCKVQQTVEYKLAEPCTSDELPGSSAEDFACWGKCRCVQSRKNSFISLEEINFQQDLPENYLSLVSTGTFRVLGTIASPTVFVALKSFYGPSRSHRHSLLAAMESSGFLGNDQNYLQLRELR